jgi:phosphoribosylanthranilate isomerase
MRVRAKICGIGRVCDAIAAVQAGADALGFNFHRGSPRYIDPRQAAAIIAELPPFVTTVGLFVNEPTTSVRNIVAVSGVQMAQFHGDETDAQCLQAGQPFIKAIHVAGPLNGRELAATYPSAAALLLDNATPAARGGTGESFDWTWWPDDCPTPLILAGGLDSDNVARAIAQVRPFAVDVSTGVEDAQKGIKNPVKIRRFIEEVQRASAGI